MLMARRSLDREYMDDHTPPPGVVDEVYRFLGGINRWFGGTRATLQRFAEFSRRWHPGERIEVLDVATGGGDLGPALIRWGQARGFDVRITALDISQSALACARRRHSHGEADALRLVCADVHQVPFPDGAFDYVTCMLFFHHLTDDGVVQALRSFDRMATRGIVINDLIRRWRHYAWTWVFTRPFNAVLRNDGPLSVKRSFRPEELAELARHAGLSWLAVRTHFGHRMTLGGERTAGRARKVAAEPEPKRRSELAT